MTHALKTWLQFFPDVAEGIKTFELRKDDRPYSIGDTLILQEYNQEKNEYTFNEMAFTITYILRDAEFFGLRQGFCILGIKEKESSY